MYSTKNSFKKFLALVLAVVMTLGVCPLTAFAEEKKPNLYLVSFGDSMTNGYGHDGYYDEWDDNNGVHHSVQVNGFLQNDVKTTYPYYLKDELDKTYNVNWTALAVSCMRTEDVNFLLRYHTNDNAWNDLAKKLDSSEEGTFGSSTVENWNNSAKAAWESTFIDDGNVIGDYFTWNEFVQGRFWDWKDSKNGSASTTNKFNTNPTLGYAEIYQKSVKNADVITLGTGNANFGVIMLQNITSLLTEQKDEEGNWKAAFGSGFKDAVSAREVLQNRLPAEIVPTALDVLDMVDEKVAPYLSSLGNVRDTQDSKAAKVLEIVEYTTVSFMFSYMDMLYAIDELNDKENLDVIMMGLMNTMDGVKIDLGDGQIFDLGAVVDGITDVLSAYYFVLPVALQELNGDFENITFYIVPNDDHIEMQVSDMADLEKIKGSNTIRERMIQEVSGMIFGLVRDSLNKALSSMDVALPNWSINDNTAYQYREKVEAYEQLQADYKAWVDGDYKGLFNIAATKEGSSELKYGALFTTGDTPTFNANDALACAVYLAFEQAIIKNADNATLDLAGLMSLMGGTGGLADMMTPIAGAMNLDPSALTNNVAASVAAQLVATGNAQYNTDPIKTAIDERIGELDTLISIPNAPDDKKAEFTDLKNGLEAIKDQPIVPAGDWYNLSFINGGATVVTNNMITVGATLSTFADSMNAEKENNVVAAPTAMFTVIELTNALNGALGTALTSYEAESLGGLLSLFARMIIGNGIGSHPTANGHLTLFNEIMEVYPDKPAKAFLEEVVKDTAEKLYQLAKSGNTEALDKIVDFALEQGVIDESQANILKTQAAKVYVAVYEQDDEAILNSCKKLADMLYRYGRANGKISDEIHAIVTEAIRVYTDVKDMDEDEIIEYAKDYITTLLDEHGTDILDAIKLFAIEQGWVTENEISAFTAKIEAVKTAVESGDMKATASAVEALVDFLAEVYKAKEPALEALKEQFAELYTKLEWYATPRKAGPYTNIVTIGASNVNGYGLRGYLKPTGDYNDDTVMEAAALNSDLKKGANVLGYNQAPAGSYPALLQKALSEQQGNTVELDQLAISSMRAEELRILLDNNYNGDAYSAWRFTDGDKWFDIADGTKDGDFSQLRSKYQNAVKNADLVTVDIGANNFGVYLSQMLTDGFKLDNDLELVDPQIGKLYNDAKAEVNKLLAEYGISVQDYAELADTLVYALVGFCYNFDKSIERIYELNPDATVVVVSIQNLMAGLKAKFGGIEVPFGDMMGALINVANTYIHYASPFAAKYLYTDVAGDAGRVEFFIDEMAAYDGNIETIDKNIIDCFNVYDGNPNDPYTNGFHVEYKVAQMLISNPAFSQITDLEGAKAYLEGNDGKTLLNKVYDAYAQILSAGAKINTLDIATLDQLDNFKSIQYALENAIGTAIVTAASSESYTLPDNFFSQIANTCGVKESVVKTVAAMAVRTDIGNSFFSHPTPAGHVTVADKILNTLNYEKTGLDWLYENIDNLDEKLYELVKEYGPEALEYVEKYAIEQGWVTEDEVATIHEWIEAAYNAKDPEGLKKFCNKLADLVSEHEDEINAFINEKVIPAIREISAKLYDLSVEYGPEALEYIKDYAVEKGWITAEQIALIEREINAAIDAYKNGKYEKVLANCKVIAAYLYNKACENGKVPEEVQEAIAKAIELYKELKDKTPDELKEWVSENLLALAEKYGPEALEKLNEYVLGLGVLDERQLGELEAKIWEFIEKYPEAPKETVKAVADELVDFLFGLTELDREKVEDMIDYLMNTSKEQMLEDAAELMQKYLEKYGPEALEYIENYLIEEGYVTADAIAEITKQVKLAIAAYEAQDKAAMKASCKKLAELVYAYADANGYIPAEVKEAYAKAIKPYEKYGEMTPEEIKALAVEELRKFIDEYKAEALVALHTYVVNEGWMTKAENIKELAEKIAAAIAAYEADPEGVTEKAINDLVDYLYNKAVAEGYIDPAKVKELNKFLDMIKDACEYFATTSEEQMKADAIARVFEKLDELTDGKMNADVYAKVKADIAGLIEKLENVKPENIQAVVNAYIESIKTKYLALIDDATHGKYVPNSESYYVALGGDTVYGTGIGKYDDGYYDLLLAELGLDGKTQYKNLGEQRLDLTKLLAYIEKNADEIEKADLITYQADATAFILAALNEETPDWSRYLTEEQIAFVEQALPVIQTILEDDWTKYADLDADKIVDDIKSDVFGAIDDAIMDAFNGQADKLDELLSICVAQVKPYVEYIQEQAFELYFEAVLSEAVLYYSLMEPVYEVLGEDWASYADLDVEQIVSEIKSEVMAKAGEVKGISEEKIPELLERCVEKALELHEYADAEIEKLPEYFSDEELAFAQAAFEFVWEYAVKQWPELAELDAEELHEKAYAEIMKLLTEADNFNYEQYADLGAEKIEEILICCVDKAMDAIEDIQSEAVEAVMVIDNAEAKFLEEAFKFAFDYLVEDWTVYVDKSAAWISNQIKDAVIAEMYKHSSFGKEYIDQYADDLAAILTACIEEVQNVLQTAQNQKDEVLNVLNTIEPFKPYIENLLFASVAYAVDTAKAVDAIQAINPDATLIVVGMYNPLDGLEIVMNGKTIDVGAYMDYLIDATNVYYTALAVADGEFTFVAVPDTEINGFENAINVDELNVGQLAKMLLKLNDSMYADAAGHEYIFEQIMGALDTTEEEPEETKAPEVVNYTKESSEDVFDAKVSFEDGNKTAVVNYDKTCVVLAAKEDDQGNTTYTRLTVVKDTTKEDTYKVDLSGVSGEYKLVVGLLGDANLDGSTNIIDAQRIYEHVQKTNTLTGVAVYFADANGDNATNIIDAQRIYEHVQKTNLLF